MVRVFFATLALIAFYAFLAAKAFASEAVPAPSLLGVSATSVPAARPRPRISLETPTTAAPPAAVPAPAPAPLSLTDRIKRWFGRVVAWILRSRLLGFLGVSR